ncbi:MAG: hypothetical protein IID37_08790 [Planctomycetes bacterium]|nr:hypothetical protein [Planctomycetota bacterium]
MRIMTLRMSIKIGLALVWVGGCSSGVPSRLGHMRLELPHHQGIDALKIAEQVLRDEYQFVVATLDHRRSLLTTRPKESFERLARTRTGDWLRGRDRVRRTVELRAVPVGTGTELYCRAIVEVFDTERLRLFAPDRRIDDNPSYTPIDRGGASTEDQKAVWVFVRRDQPLERRLLSSIKQILSSSESTLKDHSPD